MTGQQRQLLYITQLSKEAIRIGHRLHGRNWNNITPDVETYIANGGSYKQAHKAIKIGFSPHLLEISFHDTPVYEFTLDGLLMLDEYQKALEETIEAYKGKV
jgi:hypothetical protein